MKVLIATKKGQGIRDNDFSFVPEGDLVRYGFDCDGEEVDGSCGCRRSLAGMRNLKGTTTFKVADLPLTAEAYQKELLASFRRGLQGLPKKEIDKAAKEVLDDGTLQHESERLLKIAARFPVGTVLERRGNVIQPRAVSRSAQPKRSAPKAPRAKAARSTKRRSPASQLRSLR
jgi:hypothetical protein